MFAGQFCNSAPILTLLATLAYGQSLIQKVVDDTYIFDLIRLDGIQYSPQWYTDAYDPRRNQSTLHTSITAASNLVYFFQGSAIHYYADRDVPHGPARIYLDSDTDGIEVLSNASTLLYQQLLWSAANLGPGDHQLVISHAGLNGQYIGLDYLLIESDHGFIPQLAGPAAAVVPQEAIFVDDNDPRLSYSLGWDPVLPSQTLVTYFNNTMHRTNTPGATVTLKFNGTAVWYFTDLQLVHGKVNITLDDKQSWVIYGNTGQQLQQRMIWNVTDLSYGEHKVVLTHFDEASTWMTLDFFRYLPGNPPLPTSPSRIPIGAVAGATVGGLALLVAAGVILLWLRRRRLDRKARSYFESGKFASPPLINQAPVPAYGYVSRPFNMQAVASTAQENNTQGSGSRRVVKGIPVDRPQEQATHFGPPTSVATSDSTQSTRSDSLQERYDDSPPEYS